MPKLPVKKLNPEHISRNKDFGKLYYTALLHYYRSLLTGSIL